MNNGFPTFEVTVQMLLERVQEGVNSVQILGRCMLCFHLPTSIFMFFLQVE